MKDYAVYWFRKAHDRLEPGGRAGLVATNSISEGRNRQAALEYVAENGGVITNAVSEQPWPGEANVHVSIVNWGKIPPAAARHFDLDGVAVEGISTTLRPGSDAGLGARLSPNDGKQFFGVVPGGHGFILSEEEKVVLSARGDADYSDVVRPFLVGSDITNDPGQSPSRFIIDFHFNALEDAGRYPAALDRVRERVKPHRDRAKRKA